MQGDGFFAKLIPPPDHLQGLCHTDGEVERFAVQQLEEEKETFQESVRWVATDRQYFLAALISRDGKDHEVPPDGQGSGCERRAGDAEDHARAGAARPATSSRPTSG